MRSLLNKPSKLAACCVTVSFLAASNLAFAQDQSAAPPPPDTQQEASHGWPRVSGTPGPYQNGPYDTAQAPMQNGDPVRDQGGYQQTAPAPQAPAPPAGNGTYGPYNQPSYGQPSYGQPSYGQPPSGQPSYGQPSYGQPSYQPPPAQIPTQLTIPAGTYLTVRVNQALSSERNQRGDAFTATLERPVVVNGVVVAEPGETLGGQVVETQRSGHVSGLARLGVQLTDLTLVDGQKLPVQTQLIARTAPSTVGRDAAAIAGTTALGAAVGAAADWGRGAAIGAGAGLLLGTLGVLVTKGAPSVIYPEQMLTFKLEAPVTVSTGNAPQAFRYVQPGEYDRPTPAPPYPSYSAGAYPPPPPPVYYGYPYYYPYYWGPSVGFYFGPRVYYRGGYGYRYYGGHWRR